MGDVPMFAEDGPPMLLRLKEPEGWPSSDRKGGSKLLSDPL